MFDKMQYIIELPTTVNFRKIWKSQIRDSDGNALGCVIRDNPMLKQSTKPPWIWFEDKEGMRQGEMRKQKGHRLSGMEIYGPMNDLRGKIRYPLDVRLGEHHRGIYNLEDLTGRQIAASDEFSYGDKFTIAPFSNQFESLMTKGLNIRAPDGNMVAIIQGAKSYQGCQIDIYPSHVNQLLVLSLVASIMFL
jgi:hypothetical protein